uniref:Anoctamin n=1 Tax=Rodentolepis nana TaxID=102285 RepID=A0A0R3TBJ4_RODNA
LLPQYSPHLFYSTFVFEALFFIVGLVLLNPQHAKRLWKSAVEHHAFFRLKEPRAVKKGPLELFSGSSRFQYSGHTFFQYRTTQIDRPSDMPGDGIMYDENGRQKHHRTASVPANAHESLRDTRDKNKPITTATRQPPSRSPMITKQPNPKPMSRRIQPQQARQPINGQNYFENDGSLFDGASSRGEGSTIGSGIRGAEYEVSLNGILMKLSIINYHEKTIKW